MKLGIFSKTLEERRDMILNGNILKTLIILSIPTLLMAIVQSLIPLSDSYFFNNFGGYLVASAVTFCQPIINILNAISMGLGVAATAMIGQLYGKGDIKKVKHVSTQIIALAFILGLLMAPIAIIAAFLIKDFINPELSAYVFKYLSVYAAVLPFLFLAAVYNAIKNAVGEPEATFIRMLILLLMKLLFNTIFLTVFDLGILGAVLASLLSYLIIAVWMYYDLFIRKSELQLSLKNYKMDFKLIKKVMSIGVPSMINYVFVFLGFFLINMDIQEYGPRILNSQGVASNISQICFALPSSLSTTVTTMVSINIGNKDKVKAKSVYRYGFISALILSTILIAIFYRLGPAMVSLFLRNSSDKLMTDTAIRALNIYTFSVYGFSIFMIAQAVFIALGRTKFPLVLGIMRIWLFRYVFILATKSFLGVDSVFWGNLFSNYLAGTIFTIVVMKIKWNSAIDTD